MDPNKGDVSVSRLLFQLNKDKLRIGIEVRSLVTTVPTSAVSAPGTVYDYLDVRTIDFTNDDMDRSEIEYKVLNSWIEKNSIEKIEILQFVDNKWQLLKSEKVVELESANYFKASTLGYGLFAIIGKKADSAVISNRDSDAAADAENSENEGILDTYTGAATGTNDDNPNWTKIFIIFLASTMLVVLVSIAIIRNLKPYATVPVPPGQEFNPNKVELNDGMQNHAYGQNQNQSIQPQMPPVEEMSEEEIKRKVSMMLAGKKETIEQEI